MKLINIGSGNMVNFSRVIAVVSPESAPIKRIIQESKEKGLLIDASLGRKTKAVIITDSDHIILTYLTCEMISDKLRNDIKESNQNELE